MTEQKAPVIELSLRRPCNLDDIRRWTALAERIGVPDVSAVSVNSIGEHCLSLYVWLSHTWSPSDEPDTVDIDTFIELEIDRDELAAEVKRLIDERNSAAPPSDSSTSDEEAKSEVARLTAEVERLTKERDEIAAARPMGRGSHELDAAKRDVKSLTAERDKAQSEMAEMIHLVHKAQKEAEKQARLAEQAKTDLANFRKVSERQVREAREENERTIRELQEQNAHLEQSSGKALVGDAELTKGLAQLVVAIKAHQSSSHGGRMQDHGDQLLYDACSDVLKRFGSLDVSSGAPS